MGKIHELSVLALSLVWSARATPDANRRVVANAPVASQTAVELEVFFSRKNKSPRFFVANVPIASQTAVELEVRKRVVSKRVVLVDVPRYHKPERGCIQMFPGTKKQNEGTFGCSPVTKTPNEGTFAKTTLYETALLLPLEKKSQSLAICRCEATNLLYKPQNSEKLKYGKSRSKIGFPEIRKVGQKVCKKG